VQDPREEVLQPGELLQGEELQEVEEEVRRDLLLQCQDLPHHLLKKSNKKSIKTVVIR
jgi:hypothetical protein